MKTVLLKFKEEKLVIEPDSRQPKQVKYAKETNSKLTTLDTIGLAALLTCGLLLSLSMRIELDNRNDIDA